MWLFSIILLLLLFFVYVLVMPISIRIDSHKNHYELNAWYLVSGRIIPHYNDLELRLKVFGFTKSWLLYDLIVSQRKKPKSRDRKKSTPKNQALGKAYLSKGISVLRSTKVRQCRITLDTDNYIWNSYLYPIFYFLNKTRHSFSINFQGENAVVLSLENSIGRIIWAIYFHHS